MLTSLEARKDSNILWITFLKRLRGSSRVVLFKEFHRIDDDPSDLGSLILV